MPTHILFRSLLVTSVLSSPRLVSVSLPFMKTMADAKTWFFNPDRNLVLHKIVRKLIYDHFCAGENEEEAKNTIATTKAMGYEGVILGYAKEALGNENVTVTEAVRFRKAEMIDETIEVWKRGNLRTLSMLGSGDFLAIK
jgi:proline dehydrogenase